MLEVYSQYTNPMAGGFQSLSNEQQDDLLKWASLLPPASTVSVVPCSVTSTTTSDSEEEIAENSSTMSWSPPLTPGRHVSPSERSKDLDQGWLASAIPSLDLLTKRNRKSRGGLAMFKAKEKKD